MTLSNKNTMRYAFFGVVFGLGFPIFSWLADLIIFSSLPLTYANIVLIHNVNPLHFIIDTAPFFLGIAFGIAGKKQDNIEFINHNLEQLVFKRTSDLKEAVLKLEAFSHELEDKVAQRTNDLTEANKVKERMIYIISHDLRAPLRSLSGTLNLINKGVLTNDEKSLLLTQVSQSMHHTNELLENLLLWASSHGNTKAKKEQFNLGEIVGSIVALFSTIASDKKIELTCSIGPHDTVFADLNLIKLVLRNLVSNAIKFTKEGGVVSVQSMNKHGKIRISVIDNGVGMSEHQVKSLFQNHEFNESTPGTSNERGSGIGLWLCKEFIEKHHSSIEVTSAPDVGSTFSFELPTTGE